MDSIKLIYLFLCISFIISCKPKYYQGEVSYNQHCANCHGLDGEGLKSLYPPLSNSEYLENNILNLPCIIRYGLNERIVINSKEYDTPMAGIAELDEIEISNIMNFIQSKWVKESTFISPKDVKTILDSCN